MSIAAVAPRGMDEDGLGPYLSHALPGLAGAGRRVFLVTPGAGGPPLPAGVERVPAPEINGRVRYFGEVQRYADRVYDALDTLARRVRLDAVVFGPDGTEGFTTVRAKRTLGRFAGVPLVACLHTPATLVRDAVGYGRTDFSEEVRLYAERYVIAHADVVVTPTAALGRWIGETFGRTAVHLPLPLGDVPAGEPLPAPAPPELVFLGPLAPAQGADLFVAAAERILARAPAFGFRMHGVDTPTDPFGRSYRAYLERRLSPALAAQLVFRPPACAVPGGTLCLFPARCDHAPYDLLLALRSGAAVIVGRHEGVAEWVEDGVSGRVVDTTDPEAVADAVLALAADAEARRWLGQGAAGTHAGDTPAAYRDRLLAACAIVPGPPPAGGRGRSVSVVIPVFNEVGYLRETVASVQASHHDDLEIVVVDDGSTDPAVDEVLRSLEGEVVVVRRPRNGGVAAARNAGIAASAGRFVMPLDADDLIDPIYIPKALNALVRHPELAYVGCYSQNFGLLDTTYVPVGYVPDLMLFLHTDGRCTKLFDRAAIEAVGGYDEELPAFEDWDLYLRLAKAGFGGDVLPEALFHYRRHRGSTVFSWSNDIRVELLQHLARKHHDLLSERYEAVVLHLLHLWKTYYEVSESVLLQAQERAAPAPDRG